MRSISRLGAAVAIAVTVGVVLVLAGAGPASAQADDRPTDNIVVISGRADVPARDEVEAVFIVDGPVVVDGTVTGAVVALEGDVTVNGTVDEEVIALRGDVTVGSGGRIGGDVMSRHRPVIQQGGQVAGSWERWDASAVRRAFGIGSRIVIWVAMSVSTLLLGLLLGALAPRAATAVEAASRENLGATIGWGLLLTIGLPIAAVLVMLTLVALPLGLGVLLALWLIYAIGYTTGAWLLGRRVAKRTRPVVAFLAGWAILRVVAIVPVLGGLAWFVTVVVGLGAIAVATHRARRPSTAEPVRPYEGAPPAGADASPA
jgi:hypothetical protein